MFHRNFFTFIMQDEGYVAYGAYGAYGGYGYGAYQQDDSEE